MAQSTRKDRATGRHDRVLGSPLGRLTQSGVLTEVNKPAVAREQATQNNWNGAHFSSGVRLLQTEEAWHFVDTGWST